MWHALERERINTVVFFNSRFCLRPPEKTAAQSNNGGHSKGENVLLSSFSFVSGYGFMFVLVATAVFGLELLCS